MYLKSIEVQGFKSFANKIVFEFHNGITGIVGPNGSGKSNVADAVRWVLGEQSAKQLRGARMEDIIFSGTENRKPQGFASVALTIDNADHKLSIEYPEVTVARRVYRSGESEYLINGSPCRLKDVNELFYDTGIGKEGYSIIGQGQIDKILSGKPEERRELFDEAAGIVKFKRRKNEAARKLDNERQNLVRVEDILSELEKQVGPLKKQAETAHEYLRLKEELKTYDIAIYLSEAELLKKQLADLSGKEETAREQLDSAKHLEETAKEEYDKLEKELQSREAGLLALRDSISGIQMNREKLEGEIRLLEEQISNISNQDRDFAKRIEKLSEEQKEKQQQREELCKEEQDTAKLSAEAKAELSKAETELLQISQRIADGTQLVEQNRNRVIRILNEQSDIKAKVQRYEAMLEQAQIRKAELARRLIQFKSSQSVQDETIGGLKEKLKGLQVELARGEEKKRELEEQIDRMHKENLVLEKKRNDCQQSYHAERSRLEALISLTERYDGYGSSIRRVMEQKSSKSGIIGVVADIIKTEKKYETAIETALGGNIQNIVTDTEQTAKELIEFLKKNKYGRATFLPLSAVKNRSSFQNDAALREVGVIGLASDLIQVDKEYKELSEYLLGRVVVADQIDHALALARKYHYSLRIVTLEGELLNAGGSLTGGAFKNSGNLLGRRREIEELEQKVKGLLQDYQTAKNQIETNRAKNGRNREELELQKKELQERYLLQNTADMSLAHAEEEMEALLTEYKEAVTENQELERQMEDIREGRKEQEEQISVLEKENSLVESDNQSWNSKLEEERAQERIQKDRTETLRLAYANAAQRVDFIKENVERVTLEKEKLFLEIQQLKDSKEAFQSEIQEKKDKIEQTHKEIEKNRQEQAEKESRLQVDIREKEEKMLSQKESLKKREGFQADIAILDKELYRLTAQKERFCDTLDASVNYMWEEYGLTPSEAAVWGNEHTQPSMEAGELKKRAASVKNEIKALGVVNVNAIEDYKEVSERYEFLRTQHDDLKMAEETLLHIIEELDSGMRQQFQEKFEEIRIEFDRVFKELFGGGKGTLELVEEEDVLEAGIRIISQPPGKKLQNMMQLSGGEKALTAISLLFAIQNLKPSPFCLLDEIEAALDDSNVGRFAKYLHKLTKNTQFIVITHRRGTMSAADRLYGITMQEKGVSTLVSVDLIEATLEGPPKKAV